MATYPHTITNGGGERLTFLRHVVDESGDIIEAESRATPGAGPPMHAHYLQEEGMTVVSGRLGYQRLSGPPQFAGPGESAVFAPGEAHRWWNAGDDELVCTGYCKPALNVEYFLTELFDSTRRHGGKRPGMLDIAFLATRYRTEFGALMIPRPVQRVLFPVLYAAGALLGTHRRYADSPEPARPSSAGAAEGIGSS